MNNVHFNKNIRVDGHFIHFAFFRMTTINGVKYHISTIDQKKTPVVFDMQLKDHEWKISDDSKVPDWVKKLERELEMIIFNNDIS
jgi:hypothetical protein